MKAIVVLERVQVQNANATSGITWGFPGVSPFLGFTHALDRKLRGNKFPKPVLGGCAIICHSHQSHTVTDAYGEHCFSLTRNPLTKEGITAPFNEEGRMHMTVTLLMECVTDMSDYRDDCDDGSDIAEDNKWFAEKIATLVPTLRLAGGTITSFQSVECFALNLAIEGSQKIARRILYRCLPGFALVGRNELLEVHLNQLKTEKPQTDLLDAWMDFSALRYRAEHTDENKEAEWSRVALPEVGWFVPLIVGFQGIAPLQLPGSTDSVRDPTFPFAPVESVYGVGQWLSPHRVSSIDRLLWRYQYASPQQYRFINHYNAIDQTNNGD